MNLILIKNAQIVNEGQILRGDVLIQDDRIAEVAESISVKSSETKVIDADGFYLVPGMIDDQVHFREPGLTHKATIATESKAFLFPTRFPSAVSAAGKILSNPNIKKVGFGLSGDNKELRTKLGIDIVNTDDLSVKLKRIVGEKILLALGLL